jgi:hypothetical protein
VVSLTIKGNRCPNHQTLHQAKIDAKRINKREHYKGNYSRRAKLVRDNATIATYVNKDTNPMTLSKQIM